MNQELKLIPWSR